MRRHRLILAGTVLVVAMSLVLFALHQKHQEPEENHIVTRSGVPSDPPDVSAKRNDHGADQNMRNDNAVKTIQSVFSAPISFYGRVQDQKGNPVAEATVKFGAIDKFWEPGSSYQRKSDSDGMFSISGIKGAGLTVGVSKEGYDGFKGLSYQSFGYGMPPDSHRKAPPKKESPAIFVLRRKAESEPLVKISSRQFDLAQNGAPAEVNLETGKRVALGQGHLRVECWANDQSTDTEGRFDWKCRISVPGGGLVERDPEHDFEAPEDGYHESAVVDMTVDKPRQQWSSQIEKNYFLKFPKSDFARVKLTVFTGGRAFFVLESYMNPSGSRNLEYDPAKQAKSH